jgi:hypothetical protein
MMIPIEALEGYVSTAWPAEFDPAATQVAKQFKDAWASKYGQWTGSEIVGTGFYSCFKAALTKAGSLETDKVGSVVFNGLQYEGPTGAGVMVSRTDLGNNQTVDSVTTTYIKQVKNGQPSLIATINPDEESKYFYLAFPAKK